MIDYKYLANEILRACKAHKIVHVEFGTFAAVSILGFASNVKNALSALKQIADTEGYTFDFTESKKVNFNISRNHMYCIDCIYRNNTDEDDIFNIKLMCLIDIDSAECKMLLTFVE